MCIYLLHWFEIKTCIQCIRVHIPQIQEYHLNYYLLRSRHYDLYYRVYYWTVCHSNVLVSLFPSDEFNSEQELLIDQLWVNIKVQPRKMIALFRQDLAGFSETVKFLCQLSNGDHSPNFFRQTSLLFHKCLAERFNLDDA